MKREQPEERKRREQKAALVRACLAGACFVLGSLVIILWHALPIAAITLGVILLPLLVALIVNLFTAWLIKRTVTSHRNMANYSSARVCPHCNYDRSGISRQVRCPECGNLP